MLQYIVIRVVIQCEYTYIAIYRNTKVPDIPTPVFLTLPILFYICEFMIGGTGILQNKQLKILFLVPSLCSRRIKKGLYYDRSSVMLLA